MENDYIPREAAIEAVYNRIKQIGMENDPSVLSIRQTIRDIPAADVREVVTCGECKKLYKCRFSPYLGLTGFCSFGESIINCGACMREES